MLIDTHCHLNFKDFKNDFLEVANRALSNNTLMIVVGSELKTSKRSVELSNHFNRGVYSAIGLHPIHLRDILIKNDNENGKYEFKSKAEHFTLHDYQNLINSSKKIVAIGEIGLDYYHIEASSDKEREEIKKEQQEIFKIQLDLAKNNNLPVIIHCREAHHDLYPILNDFYNKNNLKQDWGVIHCFSGDYEMAKKYFNIGLKISFTGLITFVNQWDEIVKKSPIKKIMIETDSPYLSPIPHRGQRNEPLYVREVAKKIAELRKEELIKIEDILFNTSINFFKIFDF